jgi:hypothetical protein
VSSSSEDGGGGIPRSVDPFGRRGPSPVSIAPQEGGFQSPLRRLRDTSPGSLRSGGGPRRAPFFDARRMRMVRRSARTP